MSNKVDIRQAVLDARTNRDPKKVNAKVVHGDEVVEDLNTEEQEPGKADSKNSS
jgi:hypothetical protein